MIFAVPAFAALQILVNGYYAKKNTLRPMLISSFSTIISFFIYDLLGRKMAGPGLAIAAAVCFWLILGLTLLDYVYKYGRKENFQVRSFIITGVKALFASICGILSTVLLFRYFHILPLDPDKKMDALLLIGIMGLFYLVIVFVLSLLMGGEDAGTLKKLLRRIFQKPAR